MASMQQKTGEWIDSIKGAANSAEESANNSADQSANESAQQEGMDQSADVIQQSGEKATNMAQGAMEDAKNTLGMGQSNH